MGAEGGNGENGDAEGDQSHGCLLRMSFSLPGVLDIPPRILDIKYLYFSLFSEESHTEPNFYWEERADRFLSSSVSVLPDDTL